METVVCPNCGSRNAANQRFCGSCGKKLEMSCPNCGSLNSPGFKFCGNCGASLETSARSGGAEERKWATVVFADLSGFTSKSEKLDPEDARALADRCAGMLGKIVEDYGGWVNRWIGDAVLAVFGAPVAHEDDPERAVRAALDMRRCAEDNAEDFGHLTLRIGVNTGETMFAPVGPEGAREPTVTGDVVNTASRLQGAAPSGGIFVGAETHRATEKVIRYRPVEPIVAKGKEAPVEAWLAMEAIAPPAERAVSGAEMVGRDRELSLLVQIWEGVAGEGRPHLVTVIGPPGIGKSRLTKEFELAIAPARVVRGRSLPYGESTGYGAFAQQLKQLAGIYETDSAPVAGEKLEEFLAGLFPKDEARDIGRSISIVLGIGGETVADRQVLLSAARRLVEELGRREPMVFILEDIHWADASLLDLLELLSSRIRDAPVLFLTLARPEILDIRPNWGGGLGRYTAMPLEPLRSDEARDLARRLITSVDEDFAEELVERAAGNPLFLEELAATVGERTSGSLAVLPTHVKGIIAARIDLLPAPARSVLLDAAVVGKVFWRGAIARMKSDGKLDEALDTLEARDLIRRESISSMQGDAEFVFKHILIREVAYATVPKAVRRERHDVVARFIEEAAGDRMSEWSSLLAHHWREAGDKGKAVDYLVLAAERATRAWAKVESLQLLDEALELSPPDEEDRRRSLILQKALILIDAGDMATASELLESILPALRGRDLLEATLAHGKTSFWLGKVEPVANDAARLEQLSATPEGGDFAGPALMLKLQASTIQGQLTDAVELAERALKIWPPGREVDLGGLLTLSSIVHSWMGHFSEGERHGRRSLELGLEIKSVEHAITGASQTAVALAGLGRHEEALALIDESLSEWSGLEVQPRLTARALSIAAGALREMLAYEESRKMNLEAFDAAERAAFQNTKAQSAVDILFIDLGLGDIGRVQKDLSSAEEEVAKLKGWHEWLVGTRLAELRARLALAAQGPEEAAEAATRAIEMTARYYRIKYEIGSRIVLGSALGQLSRGEEAQAELRRALADAERLGHPPTLWRAAAGLTAQLYSMGNDDGAEAAHAKTKEAVEQFAASLSAEHREAFLASPEMSEITKGRGA